MILLVYCARCGTKNTDDARVCTQCGDSLYFDEERTPRSKKKAKQGDMCYDLDESTGKRVFSRRGVVIIGGIILVGHADTSTLNINLILGVLAVIFGTLNVAGGFVVTDRMLEMFQKKRKK